MMTMSDFADPGTECWSPQESEGGMYQLPGEQASV
jgi:hypothetical protein